MKSQSEATRPAIDVSTRAGLGRRGLVAGVAALLVAGVSAVTTRTARAVNGDPLLAGTTVTAISPTGINADTGGSGLAVSNSSGSGQAIQGIGSGNTTGVVGQSTGSNGVVGISNSAAGVSGNSASNAGLYGNSTSSYGVLGTSSGAPALSGSSVSSVGVFGNSSSSYGVLGTSSAVAGVAGDATNAYGVYGHSGGSYGVYGASGSNAGVAGNSGTGPGVFGSSTSGPAGQFEGNVNVNGTLSVTGMKSAVVPHPDGTHRRLYCLESTESWFEDFGDATLHSGQITIPLDLEFAALVSTAGYRVFISPLGDSRGLYVSERTTTTFTVREAQGGTSGVSFSYRLVAKRADVMGMRLERTHLPAATHGEVPAPPLEEAQAAAFPPIPRLGNADENPGGA